MWDVAKAVLRGQFIALHTYFKKRNDRKVMVNV